MLAQAIAAKHRDHLPLYRQAGIYRRQGIEIPESTLGNGIRQSSIAIPTNTWPTSCGECTLRRRGRWRS